MTIFSLNEIVGPADSSASQPVAAGTSAVPESPGTFMGNTRWPLTRETAVIIEEIVWSPADSGSAAQRKHWF